MIDVDIDSQFDCTAHRATKRRPVQAATHVRDSTRVLRLRPATMLVPTRLDELDPDMCNDATKRLG